MSLQFIMEEKREQNIAAPTGIFIRRGLICQARNEGKKIKAHPPSMGEFLTNSPSTEDLFNGIGTTP